MLLLVSQFVTHKTGNSLSNISKKTEVHAYLDNKNIRKSHSSNILLFFASFQSFCQQNV